MKHWMIAILLGAVLAGGIYASEISTTPQSRQSEDWWKQRFDEKKAEAERGDNPYVFMGDSITHGWDNPDRLSAHFPGMKIANLASGGDCTEHTLWIINNINWKKVNAKVIMLMIGTNNTGQRGREQEKPSDTFEGIQAIIKNLRKKTPDTKILLLAIFPRGEMASDQARVRNSMVNAMIPMLADNKSVFFMDINARLLDADGATLSKEIMSDLLHPTNKGYAIWGEAVKAKLEELAAMPPSKT